MDLFKSSTDSHAHSKQILDLLHDHDDFMDSINSVMDAGCGDGEDILWWANAETRDDVPERHNYRCIALDKTLKRFKRNKTVPKNLHALEGDFENYKLSRAVDLVWSHNSLQYCENPAAVLRKFTEYLTPGGVLILSVPQTVNIEYSRWASVCYPGQPFSFTISNLIYMLASAGFDCKDGMFHKQLGSPWLSAMVYKSEHTPVVTTDTTWYELMAKQLLPDSADQAVMRFGYLPQQELITRWIDQDIILWDRV
jgi:SAM-dependent methyltransferase